MAAKHARHDMREDKNFKGTDPSETTAQYLYCAYTVLQLPTSISDAVTAHASRRIPSNWKERGKSPGWGGEKKQGVW